ncbi:hypothetical protein [Planctomicrobium piriforme]|uniref:Uncharacterized protein n=1 Tax=Planctomicrobium piriforme TaxID=1576369 RepID=A0A1I3B2F5_9PLAN|nr:hypothetical protein [Planctomicrobium piriforme]SFH56360.1 hypothetical protein SAMN05421753_101186 [Planctomicrobium piriforme]
MPGSHGLRFDQTQFWVIHRRTEYGPFDYDWSPDLSGMELLYQGVKFGEVCSRQEVFADLREFRLPLRVVHVASVVMGCVVLGVSGGYNDAEKKALLVKTLQEFNCHDFVPKAA